MLQLLTYHPGKLMILARSMKWKWGRIRLSGIYMIPLLYAHKVLGSRVHRTLVNIYDISPESTGLFDLVFCGSILVHLTDPVKTLWRIRSVTKEAAIIATPVYLLRRSEPLAMFFGHERGDGWWLPNRPAIEAMIRSAGFKGWEWFSEFRLDFSDGEPGPYHGVIHAWNTDQKPEIMVNTDEPRQLSLVDYLMSTRFGLRFEPYQRRIAKWYRARKVGSNE